MKIKKREKGKMLCGKKRGTRRGFVKEKAAKQNPWQN